MLREAGGAAMPEINFADRSLPLLSVLRPRPGADVARMPR